MVVPAPPLAELGPAQETRQGLGTLDTSDHMSAHLTSGSTVLDPPAVTETASAPLLLAALNASSIATLVFDSDQRVLYANPAARLFAILLNPQTDPHALLH